MQLTEQAAPRPAIPKIAGTDLLEGVRVTVPRTTAVWGWMPLLGVVTAVGLVALAFSYAIARTAAGPITYVLYWSGLLLAYVPIAYRLLLSQPSRQERIGLVLILAFGVYLVKVLLSPTAFYFGDEFTHWRNVVNVLYTDHLFTLNSMLPATGVYPGMQIVTAAVTELTGISIYHAAIIVVGAARLVLILSLFLFFEVASRSPRIAGVATAVYAGNNNFIFYGQQFGYESLSLPLAVFAIFLIAKRTWIEDTPTLRGVNLAIIFTILAVIPTHHMTSYALIAFLLLWTLIIYLKARDLDLIYRLSKPLRDRILWLAARSRRFRRGTLWLLRLDKDVRYDVSEDNPPNTAWLTVFTIATTVFWLLVFAPMTIGYLSPVLGGALNEFFTFITGQSKAKEVFRTIPGQEIPVWERIIAFGAVGLILLGLLVGIYQVWRRHHSNFVAMTLSVVALMYPATLVMRLTKAGAETANRSSEFLFLAYGLVIAIALVELVLVGRTSVKRTSLAAAYMTVIYAGGLIAGMAWWARMPGSYLVAGDTRGIQPEGVMAAEWAASNLGRDNRLITDSMNRKLMGTFGQQFPVTGLSWIFFSPRFDSEETEALEKSRIAYVVVDYRLTSDLPINGAYFESKEPGAGNYTAPFDPILLDKFDHIAYISRLFDSGDIIVYDVSYITGVSRGTS